MKRLEAFEEDNMPRQKTQEEMESAFCELEKIRLKAKALNIVIPDNDKELLYKALTEKYGSID
jgi:hypothetical protein